MRKMEVIRLHADFFAEKGFELNPTQLMFERIIPHGKQVVFMHYTEEASFAQLEYTMGIRIDLIENLIHQFLPTLGGFVDKSITLAQPLDKMGKNPLYKFNLISFEDLQNTIHSAENFFFTEGFEWMNKMSDPEILAKEFFSQKENPFSVSNFVYTAFRGSALSKLYNPENYTRLRQVCLELLHAKELTPFTIASFLQFLNYLDHYQAA